MSEARLDLPALSPRERAELLAESQRLVALGRLDARTGPRLGMLALALGRAETRPNALTMYAAADCQPLLAGSLLEPLIGAVYGERASEAIWAALRGLTPAEQPAPEPTPATPAESELLPQGFTIDGETLEQNAQRAVVQRLHASVERRPIFAAAITAHREGRLDAWMAGEPRARRG